MSSSDNHRLNPFPLDRIVCGNRVFDLNSFFNEPAGPRRRPFPWSSIMRDIPSYARVHNIYPEFQRYSSSSGSNDHDLYRYRPSSASGVLTKHDPTNLSHSRDVTEIPVVHLLGPSSSSSTLNSVHSPWSSASSTASINTLSGGTGPLRTESEAEVDALTSTLIRKLDLTNDTTGGAHDSGARSLSTAVSSDLAAADPGTVGDGNDLSVACYRCRRPLDPRNSASIRGLALRAWFHRHCFHCYRCDAALSVEDYVHATGRVLCASCAATALERCHACDQVIRARLIRGLGRAYHPQCFTCCVCACCLDGKPFTCDVHDRILCLDDFHRRYAPRCAACGLPITPTGGSQETRRVVTKNLNYHLDCFAARRSEVAVVQ